MFISQNCIVFATSSLLVLTINSSFFDPVFVETINKYVGYKTIVHALY